MKPCPICQVTQCEHEKKFYGYGLAKIIIIQKSLETTVNVFNKLLEFLPTNAEIQYKLSTTGEDLRKCQDRISDIRRWCEKKVV